MAKKGADIFKIIKNGDVDALGEGLAKRTLSAGERNNKGQTPLHVAAQLSDFGCTEALLAHLAHGDVNAQDKNGKTPLHEAVVTGADDLVPMLLKRGAVPGIADSEGRNALHWAAQMGHAEIVHELLSDSGEPGRARSDLSVLQAADKDGNTPLHLATAESTAVALAMLSAAQRLPTTTRAALAGRQNQAGETALHFAASKDELQVVQALLDLGASPTVAAATGSTPLHQAVLGGNLHIVKLLIAAAKDDINRQDAAGHTALHLASTEGRVEVVKALLEAKADVSVRNANNLTAIVLAFESDRKEVVKILKEHGATEGDIEERKKEVEQRAAEEAEKKRGDYSAQSSDGKRIPPKIPVKKRKAKKPRQPREGEGTGGPADLVDDEEEGGTSDEGETADLEAKARAAAQKAAASRVVSRTAERKQPLIVYVIVGMMLLSTFVSIFSFLGR